MATDNKDAAGSCPVDHTARAAWLKAAASQRAAEGSTDGYPAPSAAAAAAAAATTTPKAPVAASKSLQSHLGSERVISTIPRAFVPPTPLPPFAEGRSSSSSCAAGASDLAPPPPPANSERHTSAAQNGNWIYPSEQMFFDAMRRKNYSPRPEDMRTVVPIHNAVNERAWKEIREWERGWGAEKCGGPRLQSFSGNSQALTPRARFNRLLGYTAPFDRHDWVIDRCGKKVEYVIDFYAGKQPSVSDAKNQTGARGQGQATPSLSFYLDVRPKLNSWEGWRMRIARAFGPR